MRTAMKEKGFSLPEVLIAMVLLVMIVTALSGFQRTLASDFALWSQYRTLWRYAWLQTQAETQVLPPGWQVQRLQTSDAGCVSINAIIVSPSGRKGQMTRLHCPSGQ
ncbi:prepilin-type N-terminal cleavage/methylation domain-containing protein [Yokenella regensburgei]|uniref:prepilin-type N-terminal cleavage/methylation domain-containing protein n=1 Tax=Yokenella regensburgei TaxID=158877 RepID=UPI003F144C69